MEYTQEQKAEAWQQAKLVKPDGTFRRDRCSAWIQRSHYGKTDSEYGWVIDAETKEAVHHRNEHDCCIVSERFNNISRPPSTA